MEILRVRPETLYYGDDALSTKPVMHYQGTSLLLGGVPVHPRCKLWPQTAVPPVSRDRCSPDKHYIGVHRLYDIRSLV